MRGQIQWHVLSRFTDQSGENMTANQHFFSFTENSGPSQLTATMAAEKSA
jgi:hypothetical protein